MSMSRSPVELHPGAPVIAEGVARAAAAITVDLGGRLSVDQIRE